MKIDHRPFRLKNNKIPYLIPGGPLIERFLGEEETVDAPSQMWIASLLQCGLPGARDSRSYVWEEDGGGCLADWIEADPAAYLGDEFVRRFGANTGFLLKLLNSRDRLLVQAHPDREKAARYFDHPFGKTEAWYVLAVEEGKNAYVWAGFQPGVEREGFRRLIENQECDRILNCLHRYEIVPGDVVLIPAGLPHALGSGSLVAEIQEPTDITLRAERFRPDGSELMESFLHSGIGMEGLLDCFDFRTRSREDMRAELFLSSLTESEDGGERTTCIDAGGAGCFGMCEISCHGTMSQTNDGFLVGLVLEGEGVLTWGQGKIALRKGTEFFIPYGVKAYGYETEGKLRLLECYPPLIEDQLSESV